MKNIEKVLVAVVSLPFAIALHGFALMKLYGWFVMPIWMDAPHLGFLHCYGLSMLSKLATSQHGNVIKDQYKIGFWPQLSQVFAYPVFVLLFGWIIKSMI